MNEKSGCRGEFHVAVIFTFRCSPPTTDMRLADEVASIPYMRVDQSMYDLIGGFSGLMAKNYTFALDWRAGDGRPLAASRQAVPGPLSCNTRYNIVSNQGKPIS